MTPLRARTLTDLPPNHVVMLTQIRAADIELTSRFQHKMRVNKGLDRMLVSFQANREQMAHRWCKYREGFSAELIRYIIDKADIRRGKLLDPFAGSGTTLFVASELGLDATGIELLPNGAEIIEVRNAILHSDKSNLTSSLRDFATRAPWRESGKVIEFSHLRITAGAFPPENDRALGRYLYEAAQVTEPLLSRVLRFAAMCILEQISYTRKDGQYLRWDQRSGRCVGKKVFDKGRIFSFDEAILGKLRQIAGDLEQPPAEPTLFPVLAPPNNTGTVEILRGSCLDILPKLKARSMNGLITSPPYCNRYDYTRTYALELAMLNVGEDGIRDLRQTMLSCTVENKEKLHLSAKFGKETLEAARKAFETQQVLSLVLTYLEECKSDGTINNPGIVRMVKNYFFELTLMIFASANVLERGAPFVMVNDNVRYQGAHIPVDLILSDIAEQAGFEVDTIWVLPRGKGNSSQQMALHGREEIRKCVYIWRKK